MAEADGLSSNAEATWAQPCLQASWPFLPEHTHTCTTHTFTFCANPAPVGPVQEGARVPVCHRQAQPRVRRVAGRRQRASTQRVGCAARAAVTLWSAGDPRAACRRGGPVLACPAFRLKPRCLYHILLLLLQTCTAWTPSTMGGVWRSRRSWRRIRVCAAAHALLFVHVLSHVPPLMLLLCSAACCLARPCSAALARQPRGLSSASCCAACNGAAAAPPPTPSVQPAVPAALPAVLPAMALLQLRSRRPAVLPPSRPPLPAAEAPKPNAIFDESGNFLLYSTLLGIKVGAGCPASSGRRCCSGCCSLAAEALTPARSGSLAAQAGDHGGRGHSAPCQGLSLHGPAATRACLSPLASPTRCDHCFLSDA